MAKTIEQQLDIIRIEIDKQVERTNISSVEDSLLKLQSLSGLCAELIQKAEVEMHKKQSDYLEQNATKYSAAILEKIVKGKLAYEIGLYNYATNLLRAINSKTEALRTVISLYKTELENSLQK